MLNNVEIVKDFLSKYNILYSENISLKTKTWIKRGGNAKLWIQPLSVNDLQLLCTYLYQHNIFFEIVGNTSNMYFLNTYHPEIVISTVKLIHYDILDDVISCECGVSISKLSINLTLEGIKGFEGFVSLPGTVAGSACNNSGCYGSVISSILIDADILLPSGDVKKISNEEFGYTHRSSLLKKKQLEGVILRLNFHKEFSENTKALAMKVTYNQENRKMAQEKMEGTLGSIFSNIKLKKDLAYYFVLLIRIILKLFLTKKEKRRELCSKLLFALHGKAHLLPFVSPKNYNCYLWRQSNADEYFFEYIRFIERISSNAVLEIEIRGEK